MGHGDFLVISDAGFPIPDDAKRIDLALEQDEPGIIKVLELILSDFIYERCIVTEEQKKFNPPHFERIRKLCDRCEVETIPHDEFMRTMPQKAKYIVRTGAFEPWGNIALCSGVDAPVWFRKPGVITPDYYAKRASYKERQS